MSSFKQQVQHTDIYLIDQLLKGNLDQLKTVLDVGCGRGRNLPYFLENGYDVFATDPNEQSLNAVLNLSGIHNANVKLGTAENIPFNQSFDLILCNAVLHFAKNKNHFDQMLQEMWNKLANNGILFMRLASDIGIEHLVKPLENGQYLLPDGSTRFLVNTEILLDYTHKFGAELVEPIKTTNVQNLRCMTTWILRKINA